MQGLLLKLSLDGEDEPKFWELFSSIRTELDRLYWYGGSDLWLCEGDLDLSDWSEPINTKIPGPLEAHTGATFWRPGFLGEVGDLIQEEFVSLWGVEPRDASELSTIESSKHTHFLRTRASIHLYYIDRSSWEVFSKDQRLLERLGRSLKDLLPIKTYGTDLDHRAKAFRKAGFTDFWINDL